MSSAKNWRMVTVIMWTRKCRIWLTKTCTRLAPTAETTEKEQAGATAAIKDVEHFESCRQKTIDTRESATASLRNLGFEILPSAANFVFAKPPSSLKAEDLYLQLKEQGVLVRYFNKPRISDYLRITIGTTEDMDILLAHLTAMVKS